MMSVSSAPNQGLGRDDVIMRRPDPTVGAYLSTH